MSWEGAPEPGRRWPTAVVTAVAAVVAIAAFIAARPGGDPPQSELTVGRTDDPAAEVDPGQDLLGASRPAPSEPMRRTVEAAGTGPLVPGAPAVTIIAADFVSRLQLIDLATGDVNALEVFAGGRRARPEAVRVVGDTVVLDASGDVVRIDEERQVPVMVARGHRSIPTDDTSSVWVWNGVGGRLSGTATRVGFDGTIHQRIDLPALAQPVAGTADRLLVRAPGSTSVIDADDNRRRVAPGQALVSDGTRLAWLDCNQRLICFVVIGTLDDPDQVRVQLEPDDLLAGLYTEPGEGAFSPDGRWLALSLYRAPRVGVAEAPAVAIIDVTLGATARRVPGSPLTAPSTPVAWSPDSRWLAISNGARLRVWSAATNDVAQLPIRLWPTYALAAR